MKKIFKRLTLIIIGIMLIFNLAACSDAATFKVDGKQDTSYLVTSNGGIAVQYGNYVYFVNGYRGYEDTDGNQNKKVVKGAIFRAELNGKKQAATNYSDFTIEKNAGTGLEFKSEPDVDYDDKKIDVVNVTQIAAKTVGTSGYIYGGLFIFDNYVFYASPSNEKARDGTVETNKTEFYFSKLDGSATKRIYKTENDAASSPYSFYKQNGKVYMVCLDGTDLVSIAITNGKIGKKYKIAENVTGALLPYNTTYYNGMTTNTLQDYVYFTRNITENDMVKTGNVLEVMRPDGSSREEVIMNRQSVEIDSVRDDLLFYKATEGTFKNIYYTNLATVLERKDANGNNIPNVEGLVVSQYDAYVQTYCFRPNSNSNMPFALVATDTEVRFINGNANTVIYNGKATIKDVDQSYLYFLDNSNYICRTEYATLSDKTVIADATINTAGLDIDFCAEYYVFFAQVDEWASDYTFFRKADYGLSIEAKFVGQRAEADVKPDGEDEE